MALILDNGTSNKHQHQLENPDCLLHNQQVAMSHLVYAAVLLSNMWNTGTFDFPWAWLNLSWQTFSIQDLNADA